MSFDLSLFGKRIKNARERIGLSQEQLAKELRRDQRSISQYENGRRKVLITDLPLFAKVLHVPIAYFFEDIEVEGIPDQFDTKLLIEFHRLDKDDHKTTAIKLVRLFSDAIVNDNE